MMVSNSLDGGSSAFPLMVQSLRDALDRNEFILHYQPFHDLTTQKVTGVEALIRWQHPSKGLIPPDCFIPLAERSDFINSLGAWVLQESCAQMSKWSLAGIPIAQMSINVSPRQLNDSLLPKLVEATLIKNELAADRLDIEITETARPSDEKIMCENIVSLRQLGVKISLDDFGIGYSSLDRLRMVVVDRLKIDRSFIKNISLNPRAASIVRSMIHVGQQLGVNVIAEGIEDAEACIQVQSMGCDQGQGFYFARPMDAAQCEKYLLDRRHFRMTALDESLKQDQFDLTV